MTVGITQQKNIAEHLFSSSVVNFSDVRVWKVANLQVMQWQVYVHSKTNAESDKIQSVLIKQHQLKKSVLNINNFNKNYMSHMTLVRNCYVKSMCPLKHLFQCTHARTHARTHAHTHTFNGSFSRTTRVSRYQKGKTNLDFTEARDSEW